MKTVEAPVHVVYLDDELTDFRPRGLVDACKHGFLGSFDVDFCQADLVDAGIAHGRRQRAHAAGVPPEPDAAADLAADRDRNAQCHR